MPKITFTNDSRVKADLVIDNATGVITSKKDLVVSLKGDDSNPCKAVKLFIAKIKAGGGQEK